MNYTEQQAEWITQQVLWELATSEKMAAPTAAPVVLNIPVGVLNHHAYLCHEDMDILLGYGSTLTRSKALKQPGQYAAEEMVTLHGSRNELNKVRVLGSLCNATQVEVSMADGFALGTKVPARMLGGLLDSSSIGVIDPKRWVVEHSGMIVAWCHIHISPKEAELCGLHDGMKIDIQTSGPCGGAPSHIMIRVTTDAVLESHIDMEEADDVGLHNGDTVRGMKQATRHG